MKIHHYFTFPLLVAGLLIAGCTKPESNKAPMMKPEASTITVFHNAKVYTVNEQQPWAEAVVVDGNKIVYVGDNTGAKKYMGNGAKSYDLTGKTLMPGFVSAHDHLISSKWALGGVQLFDLNTMEEVLARVKQYAEDNPDLKVIRGIGWSAGKFGRDPLAADLDKAVPDRPALLLDFTVHDGWLNTKAMEMAGVTKDTPDKLAGVTFWVRDKDGNPTGAAIEGQWFKPFVDIGAWQPEEMVSDSVDSYFTLAASSGKTTIQNTGILTPNLIDTHGGMEKDFETILAMLHKRELAGTLQLRVIPQPMLKSNTADPKRLAAFTKKMREKYNSDMLRVQSIKIHPEGNWTAETAPFLKPYESGKMGTFNVPPELIAAQILEAAKLGLDCSVHSDSSGSAKAFIDGVVAAKEAGFTDNRSAIHHATWLPKETRDRIIKYKIPVNATPSFTTDWSGTDDNAIRLLGQKRVDEMFGYYQNLYHAGVSVSIASDVPSTPASMQAPFYVMQVAATNVQPEDPNSKPFPPGRDVLTIAEAIRAHTIIPAWQLRMEDKIGSLEVGKLADLVVVDRNPLELKPTELADVKVLATMLDGKFTHNTGL